MKIKPTTLFLVLTALILAGVVAVVIQQPAPQQAEATGQQKLFGFEEKQVQAFSLKTQLRSLKFERDKAGKWQMLEPDKTPASDPSVAYLLDLLVAGKSDRSLTASAGDQKDYGFQQPLATIEVKLNNQETHKLILGGYDFNHSFIYAQADPPAESTAPSKVLLVSSNFENAVSRPLSEWKQSSTAKEQTPKNSASESLPTKVAPGTKATQPGSQSAKPSPAKEQATPEDSGSKEQAPSSP